MREVPSLNALAQDRNRAFELTPVSRETAERIDAFVRLLLDRQRHVNLIAQSTLPTIYTRHVADSLQLLTTAPKALTWLDIGSGGGFPAIPVACALTETVDTTVDMVESVGKKADFLSEVVAKIGLRARVHHIRIEKFQPAKLSDVITARALAPLPVLLSYIKPLLKADGTALLMKGQDVEAELTQATKSWNMVYDLVKSITSADSHVIVVRDLFRIDGRDQRSRDSQPEINAEGRKR